MTKFGAATLLLMFACAASAQETIDGSDKNFDQALLDSIAAAVQPKNSMPRKVMIRDLRRAKVDQSTICGSVTVEDRFGTYPNFEPFVIYSGTFYLQAADVCQ